MEWLMVNRRRLGTGMLVFGVAGVLVAGIVAVALVAGAFAARNLDERLAQDQARIAQSLTRLSSTMESLAMTTQHASDTLETSSQAMVDAQGVIQTSAGTLVTISDALDVSILGNQPFLRASEALADLARTVSSFEGRVETLGINLHQNAADIELMTSQIRDLKTQVTELASRVYAFDRLGELAGLLVAGLLVSALVNAWIAGAAAFLAWMGWKLRRLPPPVEAPVPEPPAGA